METVPVTPTFDLNGRRALVTGVGLGLAAATVTLVSRTRDKIAAAASFGRAEVPPRP